MATNCSNCNNCKDECSCIPTGVTTPNYCLSDTPPCPQPAPCTETFDSKCIIYTGDGNECLGIEADQTVEEIIDILAQKLEPLICLGCVTSIIPANNTTEVELTQILSWAPVVNATGYDVYFGTDQTLVENSDPSVLVSSNQISTNYNPPGLLGADKTFYWKIVPRNGPVQIVDCLTYTFSTVSVCVNPLEEVFTTILEVIPTTGPDPVELTIEIKDTIETILGNGFVFGKSCGACCPDCVTNRYVLSNVSTFGSYYEAVYGQGELPQGSPCCVEITASYSAYSTLGKLFEVAPPTGECSCENNYDNCLQQLKGLFATSIWLNILDDGIVEESTLGGFTSLCILKDFVAALPSILSQAEKADILKSLLDIGIVVECTENSINISSVKAYTNNLNPGSPEKN